MAGSRLKKNLVEVTHARQDDPVISTAAGNKLAFRASGCPPELCKSKGSIVLPFVAATTLSPKFLDIGKIHVLKNIQLALSEYDAFKRKSRKQRPDPNSKQKLLQWLNEVTALEIIEHLQTELDLHEVLSFDSSNEMYYKRRLSLLRYLSRKFLVLPSSLSLQGITQTGRNPVAGGGFADIWAGMLHGRPVCLKVLRLVIEPDEKERSKIREQFCRETLVWRQLRHPNILPLLGINTTLFFPSFCLVSPWMANKDIITYLKQNPRHLDLSSALSEIAAGLHYLHSQDPPIVHGDIRGANILVTDDFRCCLADFGLTQLTTDSQTWSVATSTSATKGAVRWMAPEYIIPQSNSPGPPTNCTSRDVYAFGCTIIEILTRKIPFEDCRTDAAVLFCLVKGERPDRPAREFWCPDSVWHLTTRCWAENAQDRPSAQEIYKILGCRPVVETTTTKRRGDLSQFFNAHSEVTGVFSLGKHPWTSSAPSAVQLIKSIGYHYGIFVRRRSVVPVGSYLPRVLKRRYD